MVTSSTIFCRKLIDNRWRESHIKNQGFGWSQHTTGSEYWTSWCGPDLTSLTRRHPPAFSWH